MRICPIASGSSGNCIYVGSDNTHILVDCGISGKKILSGLNSLEVDGNDIDGIVVTHEHTDHIMSIGVLARRFHKPIYATKGTIEAFKSYSSLGVIDDNLLHVIKADDEFYINDMLVRPIQISHDAAEPVAFRFENGKKSVAVMTDLGFYNEYIASSLQNLDALLVEANHDVNMLQVGPYPYPLKQRILSDRGHLSNEASGRLISDILHDDLKAIYLGHLSKENNLPELAYETVRIEINVSDTPYNGSDFPLYVASRYEPSVCTEF